MRIQLRQVHPVVMPTGLREIGQSVDETSTWLAGCENCMVSPMAMQVYRETANEPPVLFDHWNAHDPILRQALAEKYGVNPEQVFVTSGAYGGLETVAVLCFGTGVTVGIRVPDWPGFLHFIEMGGATALPVETMEFPFTLSAHDFALKLQTTAADAFLIANPSATQGHEYGVDEVEYLLSADPDRLGIIDEADSVLPQHSSAHLSKNYHNGIWIGSLSKFYGLSGQRIGYMIVPTALIEPVKNVIGPCTVSATAVRCAIAALADNDFQKQTQQRVAESWRTLQAACITSLFQVAGSEGCFASFLVANPGAPDPYTYLKAHGIHLNQSETFGLPKGCGGRMNLSDPSKVAKAIEIIRKM